MVFAEMRTSDYMQQTIFINSSPQEAYRRQDVLTASSIDLIVMLYDALKKNVILGRRAIDKKDVIGAHKSLMKAQDIVAELINSLDMNYQLSEELLTIYEYILGQLQDANIRKNKEPLAPVIEMVDSIRDAWKEVCLTNKGNMYISEEQA